MDNTRVQKGPKREMNKLSKYLLSAVLVIVALLLLLGTLSPFLLMMFNSVSHAMNDGYEVPMRVVGANYPVFSLYILAFSFIVCMLLLYMSAKRREITTALFWINGISISFIISYAVALLELLVINLVD